MAYPRFTQVVALYAPERAVTAMADFAPNFTARFRVRYSSLGKSHSMMWRVASSTTDPTAISAKVGLVLDDLAPLLFNDFTIIAADFALADTDVFLPAPSPAFGGGDVSAAGGVPNDAAVSVSFVGRTTLGNKARMFLYGTNSGAVMRTTTAQDFKLTSAESAAVSAAIVRINETGPAIVGNDDAVASWYEYVNVKYNDRWLRRFRRG